ncbi:MAG: hypothetical protein AAB289_02250 [Chloroflexota bacterium]
MIRQTTTLLVGAACAGWSAWLALVVYVPPDQLWSRLLFLGLGLLALAATGTLVAWVFGSRRRTTEGGEPEVVRAAFLGIGFAVAATVSLWLQAERMLSPVHLIVLFGSYWLINLLLWSGRTSR